MVSQPRKKDTFRGELGGQFTGRVDTAKKQSICMGPASYVRFMARRCKLGNGC